MKCHLLLPIVFYFDPLAVAFSQKDALLKIRQVPLWMRRVTLEIDIDEQPHPTMARGSIRKDNTILVTFPCMRYSST